MVLTGGKYIMTTVSLYDTGGWVRDMPVLNKGRWRHGCTSYFTGGEKVRMAIRCHDNNFYPPAGSPGDRWLW